MNWPFVCYVLAELYFRAQLWLPSARGYQYLRRQLELKLEWKTGTGTNNPA